MKIILIVDDSLTELTNLRGIVEAQGWRSIAASNGAEAIEKAARERPNLILLDIVMPDVDGYQICRQLQADPATKDIPIVFVSSKNQKADHVWARMQGGRALIGKPYTAQAIVDIVKALS
jgi:twitching motility two-component system response regulator PilH